MTDDLARITSAETMGELIRKRRRALGMSQEVVASLTGIPQPNVSKIERGRCASALETYLRLLSALGIDLFGRAKQ